MRADASILPEGWMVEGEDRSVGIFGDYFWHDACPVAGDIEEATVTEAFAGFRGEGFRRMAVTVVGLQCPACGASATFRREDYAPDDDEGEG